MDKELEAMKKRTRELLYSKSGIVPNETISNSKTIASTQKGLIWRPNNYRREMPIKPNFYLNNSTIKNLHTTIDSTYKLQNLEVKISKHTKLITIYNFFGTIVQIGKNKITAILPQLKIENEKQYYHLEGNIEAIESYLTDEKEKRRILLDSSITKIIDLFNLRLPNTKIKWQRYEDYIRGDEVLDKLPTHTVIHHRLGKKVYDEGWEFHTAGDEEEPTANLINYIKERSLEKNYDHIKDTLKEIKDNVIGIKKDSLTFLKKNINSINDIFNYTNMVTNLTITEKEDLEEWLFIKFSI